MCRCLAVLCQLVIVLLAWRWSYSASGFLLNGPGVALLLDRFLLRVLPWPAPVSQRRELAGCAAANGTANAAAGGIHAVQDIYAEALEYGIAFGMVHAYDATLSENRPPQAVKT